VSLTSLVTPAGDERSPGAARPWQSNDARSKGTVMATAAPDTTPTASTAPELEQGLSGWGVFAAVIMFMAGTFSFLYGLGAVLNDEVVTVGGGGGVIVWDFTAWGWAHMALGVLMFSASLSLFARRGWARWTAVVLATINAIAQLTIITAFPIWALIVIALDVTVIYQLTVNWARTA
jgi:hypothetical protein